MPFPKQYDLPFSRVQLLLDRLDVPLRKRKPTCYFVDSMSDLFHEDVPDEFIARVFDAMCAVPYGKDGEPKRGWWDVNPHRYLILTKRPERMRRFVLEDIYRAIEGWPGDSALSGAIEVGAWPLPNVWLGTSVEDQASADKRIPHLLATPAAVRFLSCEPLLGPVDLTQLTMVVPEPPNGPGVWLDAITGYVTGPDEVLPDRISWVIIGGESGPHARPMDLAWARSLVAQCRAAGVPVFVKQDSGPRPGMQGRMPDELWLKEWPHG